MNFASIVGLIAATLTTSAFVPQAYKILKLRQTKHLSMTMYIMMFSGQVMWLIYGLFQKDLPIILANVVGASLSGTILGFKIFLKE